MSKSPEYKTVNLIPILVSDFLIPSLNNYPYTPPITTNETLLLIGVFPVMLFTIIIKRIMIKENNR